MQNRFSLEELDANEWVKKSHDDELNANSILTHRDGAPSGVCFLSQQMAEKLLKGLLVFYKKEFPKIHDLLELQTLILDMEPKIRNLDNELDLLNTYYFETRYPGDYPEFSWQEAKEAFEAATRIKEFMLDKIKHKS